MQDCEVKELFEYCRKGQLDNLKSLVEEGELEVNIRDKWDSTPLYYACLCGHEKTVEYLLQIGARCQANTFDGERCLYSALTQKIKEMVKDFKAITKDSMRRDNYVEFFKMCLSSHIHKDVCFIVHGCHIFVHKIIVATRSPYFGQMFETKWKDKRYIHLKHPLVTASAFEFVIQYLYTDRVDIPIEEVEDVKMLSKQCQLTDLQQKLDVSEKNYHNYADTKPKSLRDKVSILSIQPEYNSGALNDSFAHLANYCIPNNLRLKQFRVCFPDMPDIFYMELPELEEETTVYKDHLCQNEMPAYADICFTVDNHHFYGHKLFFCGRSDYFKAMDHFSGVSSSVNADDDGILHVTLNDISPDVFAIIVTFVYTNSAIVPDENVGEVLHFAALYLLPSLKKYCSNKMIDLLEIDNVLEIFKLSRLYNLGVLESSCCEFMARHLCEIVNDSEFSSLVLADAHQIKGRQETDTIPIVDDIRFHMHKEALPGMSSCDVEYSTSTDQKFQMLDSLLDKLGLEA